MRKTKIIATIGPATASRDVMEKIIIAGVDIVRLNFSHGDFEYHAKNLIQAREIAQQHNKNIGVLVDLPGPKLRIKHFVNDSIQLIEGQAFAIDANYDQPGDETIVGVDYKQLTNDCKTGDYLLLDDGNIELIIEAIEDSRVHTKVVRGGKLSNNKGLNRKGGGLSAPAIGEKDKLILDFCAPYGVDFVAVSFVSSADDISLVRSINEKNNCKALIISKIERAELVNDAERLQAVLQASDGVMVARGDLAVEVGVSELVGHQKQIISTSVQEDKFVIMATQMMESMTYAPNPTRAEVSDVGNAVLDGVDAVMLSGETAVGEYPVQTINSMVSVCLGNEKHTNLIARHKKSHNASIRIDKATAASAAHMTFLMPNVGAIICFTESGATPRWISRYFITQPIVAVTRNEYAYHSISILRNVIAYYVEYGKLDLFLNNNFKNEILMKLLDSALIKEDDYIVMSHGFPSHMVGYTNSVALYAVRALLNDSTSVI